jgi:arylsulfatase A-like enzyme
MMKNVVIVISDTLRRDHLGCYGNEWIRTPNIDRLARESFVFDNAYAASFPTVPNRCDVMTGQFTFIDFDWSPLPADKPVVAEALGEADYTTYFCVDTPHIARAQQNFFRGFSGYDWVRGQENDNWKTAPADPVLPCAENKIRHSGVGTVRQYIRNTNWWQGEEDTFPARTMRTAARWLEENYKQPFFMYVDTFDPHEPFDPPEWYADLYADPEYDGQVCYYPNYGPAEVYTEAELRHMRALYAGEVSLVDTWVGYLLRRMEQLGVLDETMVIMTTDHGFYLGEHGLTGKVLIQEEGTAICQLYEEVAHIPLMIRMPGQRDEQRIAAYAQPPDLMPTILELTGAPDPGTMNGASLLPVMSGERESNRDIAITTASLAHDPNGGRPVTITKGDWCLVHFGSPDAPSVSHVTNIVDDTARQAVVVGEKIPAAELYNLRDDPGQQKNVIGEHPDVAQKLHAEHIRMLEELGMEERYLQHRREL